MIVVEDSSDVSIVEDIFSEENNNISYSGKLVEGVVETGQSVVVIEDLISTGGSSLKAVQALRENGCIIKGMAAIFSYQFPTAENNFKSAGCRLVTLSNYHALIDSAVSNGYVSSADIETLKNWRNDPGNWRNDLKTETAK